MVRRNNDIYGMRSVGMILDRYYSYEPHLTYKIYRYCSNQYTYEILNIIHDTPVRYTRYDMIHDTSMRHTRSDMIHDTPMRHTRSDISYT